MSLTPADRYAAAKARTSFPRTTEFINSLRFELDDFQIRAAHALESGEGVLVAAPTGAGKTIVGEFAAHLAILSGTRCFYTTPIKALSNQKFAELRDRYGDDRVGLLTGDSSINTDAQVLVMTTEVLRNMIYATPGSLHDLSYVVMDEVHYLADRFRGAVWEEVLIHLPDSVQVVSLSATVSNAEEFGEWLNLVRGKTSIIVSESRPVPLYQHVLMGHRLLDLFEESGRINPEVLKLERMHSQKVRSGRGGNSHGRDGWQRERDSGIKVIPRADVIEKLDRNGMLPAITFIFSRNACAAAVKQCIAAGLNLTDSQERRTIRDLVFDRCAHIPDEDLAILEFPEWLNGLERGIAAHHAGLLPTFKEVVEELFQRGLVKAVFATETLALGINMPARTVVLEKLSKWNGEGHVMITPGEFTQLSGRAGRRGIDIEGNSVVLWNNEMDSASIAGLASNRTYPLRSSFKPTYNMSVNLISGFGVERARTSLEASFAQFQADQAVVGLAKQIKRNEAGFAELMSRAICDLGNFGEYAEIKEEIRNLEKESARANKGARSKAIQRIEELRNQLRHHPCHSCPDREPHSRLAERAYRLHRETLSLQERVNNRTNVIARRFDLVQIVLGQLGYLHDEELTPAGRLLSKVYSESDLLVAETLKSGALAQLSPAELAAVVSSLVFEARKDQSAKIPNANIEEALTEIISCWSKISRIEEELHLDGIRPPDFGFVNATYRWARGNSLTSILRGTELSVGDFIRSMKQVIDLLRQIAALDEGISAGARSALKQIDRGIVTFAGVVG